MRLAQRDAHAQLHLAACALLMMHRALTLTSSRPLQQRQRLRLQPFASVREDASDVLADSRCLTRCPSRMDTDSGLKHACAFAPDDLR